jgi:hypothetical protein
MVPSPPQAGTPYWIPVGIDFDRLPEELRTALLGIVNPAYELFVVEAPDGMEQAIGKTVVHLLWLEILEEIRLGRDLLGAGSAESDRDERMSRYLRIVDAKAKASDLLLRIREYRTRPGADPLQRMPDWPLLDSRLSHDRLSPDDFPKDEE